MVFAKSIGDRLAFCKRSTGENLDDAITYFKERIGGRGGFMLINNQGKCFRRFTTRKITNGWIEYNGKTARSF